MPELQRFGAVSLRMYADDHHPPHFHVVSPSFEVIVRLADFAVVAGVARANEIEQAMRWARENALELDAKWKELNERD